MAERTAATDLERYIRVHIPLAAAMGVRVDEASAARVVLSAPLEPNINHRDTAFGGSVASLAVLSAWALVHLRLTSEGIDANVVIQRNEVRYERPVTARFTATSAAVDEDAWRRFRSLLARRGRARIELAANVTCADERAAMFTGEFVALSR